MKTWALRLLGSRARASLRRTASPGSNTRPSEAQLRPDHKSSESRVAFRRNKLNHDITGGKRRRANGGKRWAYKKRPDSILDDSSQNSTVALPFLIDFMQDRIVLVAAESEADTKFVRQPQLYDSSAIKFPAQEEVESAVVPLDDFKNRVCDWRVFLSSAHVTLLFQFSLNRIFRSRHIPSDVQ